MLLGLDFQEAEIDMMLRARKQRPRRLRNPSQNGRPAQHRAGILVPSRIARTARPSRGRARFEPTVSTQPRQSAGQSRRCGILAGDPAAPLVRSRAVTSTALTRMYLARMKKYGPKLLCLVTLTEDLALEQAAAADQEIKAGHTRSAARHSFRRQGPVRYQGHPDHLGRRALPESRAGRGRDRRGAAAQSRRGADRQTFDGRAGAGRPLVPGAHEESLEPRSRASSGSSAGSASATAAGLVGFSLGTETLGSIVSPSTQCGTVGLRPTYGRISRHGAMALSWTMDKIGPICRGVEDCALVLNAVYGPDGHDRTVGADPVPLGAAEAA